MAATTEDAVRLAVEEVGRQDAAHPVGYPPTRDGVRVGLASVADELDEALAAWRSERRQDGWPLTAGELVQAVAVGLRLLRSVAGRA